MADASKLGTCWTSELCGCVAVAGFVEAWATARLTETEVITNIKRILRMQFASTEKKMGISFCKNGSTNKESILDSQCLAWIARSGGEQQRIEPRGVSSAGSEYPEPDGQVFLRVLAHGF